MKVLVIESEADSRKNIMRCLSEAFPHAEIHPYDPGASGRPDAEFNWARFDVLILDYHLGPEENGLDWLREFRHTTSRFPATILLTSADEEEVAVKALRHGAHDFLSKQDLSAHKLAEAVADALNVRYRESSAESSLTLNASKFSKSFFYGQLNLAFDEAEAGGHRALVLIRLDGYDALRKSLGVLAMEDVTRHLANLGMETFRFGAYRPRATRFSDASIGILIGGYEDNRGLEGALAKYCERIDDSPPEVGDATIPVTVSVGAVVIRSRPMGVYGLFEHAEQAAAEASETQGNSYVVKMPDVDGRIQVEAAAGEGGFDVDAAVKDNRIQAMFGAITAVSDRGADVDLNDFFEIDPHFISPAGDHVPVSRVFDRNSDEILAKAIDRWSIGECAQRLFSSSQHNERAAPTFLVDVSEPTSISDEMIAWMDELVSGDGGPGNLKGVYLSIAPDVLLRHTKKVVPLCAGLNERFGVRFVLKDVEDPAMCKVCLAQYHFDLIVLSDACTSSIIGREKKSMESRKLLELAAARDILTIARGIGDANALHGVISAGVDFVHGDFIAPEQEEVEAAIGIETVQLDDTGEWRL